MEAGDSDNAGATGSKRRAVTRIVGISVIVLVAVVLLVGVVPWPILGDRGGVLEVALAWELPGSAGERCRARGAAYRCYATATNSSGETYDLEYIVTVGQWGCWSAVQEVRGSLGDAFLSRTPLELSGCIRGWHYL